MGWRLVSEAEIQEQAALYRELVAVAADGPDRFDAAYWWLRSARVSFSRRSYGSPDAKHEALIPWEALVQRAAVAQRDAAERIDAVLPQEFRERSPVRLAHRAKFDEATTPLDRLTAAYVWVRWASRQLDKPGNRWAFEGIDLPAAKRIRDQVMDETGLRIAAWAEEISATKERA
jgi:hypothetical protein